jgi:hypothetical protein
MVVETAHERITPHPGAHSLLELRLRERAAFRFGAVFLGVGLALLEIADALVSAVGLPPAIYRAIAYLFVAGLPTVVGAGWVIDWRRGRTPGQPAGDQGGGARPAGADHSAPVGGEAGDGTRDAEPKAAALSTSGRPSSSSLPAFLVLGLASSAVALSFGLAFVGWSRLGLETYLALWATVCSGIWMLFDQSERSVAAEVRADVARLLMTPRLRETVSRVPHLFRDAFDRVFGARHLSWRCFSRSCAASLLSVTAVLAFWLTTRPEARMLASDPALLGAVVWLVALTGLMNFVPDYFSLLETRFLLGKAAGRWRTGAILLVDALVTAAISFVLIRVSMEVVYGSGVVIGSGSGSIVATDGVAQRAIDFGRWSDQLTDMVLFRESYGGITLSMVVDGSSGYGEVPVPVGIFFWSAFVTSAWLWLFALAHTLLSVIARLGEGFAPILRLFEVQVAPFRAMGFASVLLVSVAFAAGLPMVLV